MGWGLKDTQFTHRMRELHKCVYGQSSASTPDVITSLFPYLTVTDPLLHCSPAASPAISRDPLQWTFVPQLTHWVWTAEVKSWYKILVQLVLWSDKCVFSFRHSWNTTGQSCCWDLRAFSSVEVECFETEGRLNQEETALRRYSLLAKCERRPHSYPVPHSHLLEITE